MTGRRDFRREKIEFSPTVEILGPRLRSLGLDQASKFSQEDGEETGARHLRTVQVSLPLLGQERESNLLYPL